MTWSLVGLTTRTMPLPFLTEVSVRATPKSTTGGGCGSSIPTYVSVKGFAISHIITTQYPFKTNKTQQNNKRILPIQKVQSKGREGEKKTKKTSHSFI